MQENEGGRECKKGLVRREGGEGLNEGAGLVQQPCWWQGWSGFERVEGCVGWPGWPRAAPGRAAAASQTL